WVRAPARWLLLATLALALLAGFGLDTLRAGRGRRAARATSAALVLLALFLAGSASGIGWTGGVLAALDPAGTGRPETLVLAGGLAAAAVLLVLLVRRGETDGRVVALALAFAAADLYLFGASLSFNRLAPRDAFDAPSETVRAIASEPAAARFFRWSLGRVDMGRMLFDEPDPETYRRISREGLVRSPAMCYGLQSLTGFGTESAAPAELIEVVARRGAFDSRAARLTGAFGARYVIGAGRLPAPELTLVKKGLFDVYRNEA